MNIELDKYKHFLAGSIGAFITSVLVLLFNENLFVIPFLGVFASYGWESYQWVFKTGKFEWKDALWSVSPFVMFFIVTIIK